MKCPFCGEDNTRVIDSRPSEENNAIRRRRQCDSCKKRFTTYEKVESIPLIVVKRDNNREPFERSKIEAGILRSCHKRPISVDQIRAIADEVENEVYRPVAYVRFASVYRDFKDVNTFMEELKLFLDN